MKPYVKSQDILIFSKSFCTKSAHNILHYPFLLDWCELPPAWLVDSIWDFHIIAGLHIGKSGRGTLYIQVQFVSFSKSRKCIRVRHPFDKMGWLYLLNKIPLTATTTFFERYQTMTWRDESSLRAYYEWFCRRKRCFWLFLIIFGFICGLWWGKN